MATGQDAAALLSLVGARRIGPLVFERLREMATGGGTADASPSERRAAAMARKLARKKC